MGLNGMSASRRQPWPAKITRLNERSTLEPTAEEIRAVISTVEPRPDPVSKADMEGSSARSSRESPPPRVARHLP